MTLLFPAVLSTNEIKCALFPVSDEAFYCSERLKTIMENSTLDHLPLDFLKILENDDDEFNYLTYAVVLNKYYHYSVDFTRPIIVKVPNKSGETRTYKVTYNADFMDIYPNENAIEITEDILDELLNNTHNKEIWLKYFPDNSWTVKGFGLMSLTDVTLDEHIDLFKEHLIESSDNEESILNLFDKDLRNIFGIQELIFGGAQVQENLILPGWDVNLHSYILNGRKSLPIENFACSYVRDTLFNKKEKVVIPNVKTYDGGNENNTLRKSLLAQNVHSVLFFPLIVDGEVQSIIEICAPKKNQLNAINIVKLDDLMPFIQSFAERSVNELENRLSAIIQRECTSIHPAVEWRFEQEALRFFQQNQLGKEPNFQEIVFENVFPLFGQIDIVGSSKARNKAIQEDLTEQLSESIAILQEVTNEHSMPFYEQLIFNANKHLTKLNKQFSSSSEQTINHFFQGEILPVFNYLNKSSDIQSTRLTEFLAQIDFENLTLYKERKKYDNTVDGINKQLAHFLDEKQKDAQAIFPHYFEKYKTDGVEHNLYVGQSIAQNKTYHQTVLYNLRLWQLQVMCEMESMFYASQQNLSVQLKVASLILAYDSPMSIRYRIDEKQFDVDGAYNVRYEMIKKRIDKAHIKNTNERLTQPNLLSVVYSNPEIEREYLSYFEFLQSKGYIGKTIEVVELEELQGASGLKAIRAEINHNLNLAEKIYTPWQICNSTKVK